jgi:hypothetical protein
VPSQARNDEVEAAMAAIQARNEELQLSRARVSEADMAELQTEFETRLGAAERRVFALKHERDAARAAAAAAPPPAAIAERDTALQQVRKIQPCDRAPVRLEVCGKPPPACL